MIICIHGPEIPVPTANCSWIGSSIRNSSKVSNLLKFHAKNLQKSWLSGGIHMFKSKKSTQKNTSDFSPWSGHLVDPFDPTVLRP